MSLNAALAASDTLSPFENPRRHWHLGTFTRVSQQFQGAHGSSRNSGSPGNLLNMALVIYQDMSGCSLHVTNNRSFFHRPGFVLNAFRGVVRDHHSKILGKNGIVMVPW